VLRQKRYEWKDSHAVAVSHLANHQALWNMSGLLNTSDFFLTYISELLWIIRITFLMMTRDAGATWTHTSIPSISMSRTPFEGSELMY
jgi:hypothetical protein